MIRTYLPTQDASIYEDFSWKNTGHDEILEFGRSSAEPSASIRSLIQFNIADISASLADRTIPANSTFELKLNVARVDNLQLGQVIHLMMITGSWVEGSGYFYQNTNVPLMTASLVGPYPTTGYVETDGTTWKTRASGTLWRASGSDVIAASGTLSQSVADPVVALVFDVTNFIAKWVSGSANAGMVIKFSAADESNSFYAGNIKCFSRQTHTIYAPTLTSKWNSQTYITGTLSNADLSGVLINPTNLARTYTSGDMARVKLSVRDQYPLKTFAEQFVLYAGNQLLPSSSYFSIVDAQSNYVVIPFGDSSRINCDGTGSYFDFYIEGMYPGRIYKTMVKTTNGTFTRHFDMGHTFTIGQV